MITGIWIRITGTLNTVVTVQIGSQETLNGVVTYKSTRQYIIGVTKFIDCMVDGRFFALKFSANTPEAFWELQGFEFEAVKLGRF